MSPNITATPSTLGNGRPTYAHLLLALALLPLTARAGHLTGEVPRGVERSGVAAIAREVERVDCLDCHVAHGAGSAALLSRPALRSEACVDCHTGASPARGLRDHPIGERIEDPAVLAGLAAARWPLGPDRTVACLTCHRIHGDLGDTEFEPAQVGRDVCLGCHPEQERMAGGGHDLRVYGDPKGLTCLACHTMHGASGPALGLTGGGLLDPTGCLSCHDGSRPEVKHSVDPDDGHPLFEPNPSPELLPSMGRDGSLELGTAGDMGCLTCHDTHAPASPDNPRLLRMPGGDAEECLACHEDQRPALDSDHDMRAWRETTPETQEAMVYGGFCASCHQVHGERELPHWDGPDGTDHDVSIATSRCMGCHQPDNDLDATEIVEWEHPQDLLLTTANLPWSNTGELPLYDLDGHETDDNDIGRIACLTCHDPHVWSPKHGGSGGGRGDGDIRTSFLRPDWEGFCSGCHGEDALPRYRNFHDTEFRIKVEELRERRDWPVYERAE